MEADDMTLDEAIAHCDEVAGACDTECRREHKQLADWLRELKDRRRYQVGDAAAMREALEYASRVLAKWRQDAPFSAWNEYGEAIDRCRAALAAPPRQCDVGTAEEQAERFRTFCASHFDKINCKCGDCPAKYHIDGCGRPYCQLKWAQMPYEAGGAK